MSGKPQFVEEYSAKNVDPLYLTSVGFDYEAVEAALGESAKDDEVRRQVIAVITRIFQHCTNVRLGNDIATRQIGRRFAALAWVLNPGLFTGSPSATKLARLLGINSSPEFLKLTGEASREFGITNRGQAHAWNRAKQKEIHVPTA